MLPFVQTLKMNGLISSLPYHDQTIFYSNDFFFFLKKKIGKIIKQTSTSSVVPFISTITLAISVAFISIFDGTIIGCVSTRFITDH